MYFGYEKDKNYGIYPKLYKLKLLIYNRNSSVMQWLVYMTTVIEVHGYRLFQVIF